MTVNFNPFIRIGQHLGTSEKSEMPKTAERIRGKILRGYDHPVQGQGVLSELQREETCG